MTVAELRAALAGYPDDMPVAVRTMQVSGSEDSYCVGIDDLSVRDIWHEDDHRGFDDPEAEGPQTVPTLIINDFYEVVGL